MQTLEVPVGIVEELTDTLWSMTQNYLIEKIEISEDGQFRIYGRERDNLSPPAFTDVGTIVMRINRQR